jgi:hypothetical protein
MARAAGINTDGMTPGEVKALASWAANTERTIILPGA